MQKLAQLWQAIEDISGQVGLRTTWAEKCGQAFTQIEPFLLPTSDFAPRYPCPRPTGYSCPRLVVEDGDGTFDAICQDPQRICQDLSLSAKEVLLHSLDLYGFMKPILEAAGIRNSQMESLTPGVWNVGLASAGDLSLQPAYLLIFGNTEEFGGAAQSLKFEIEGAFTIVAPTERHWTGTLRERMSPPRITFIPLNERIALDDSERFVAVRPPSSADGLKATPPGQREELIEQFRHNNGNCAINQICYWANVSRADLNKWKNARPVVPDTSVKAIRIEKLLQFGVKTCE